MEGSILIGTVFDDFLPQLKLKEMVGADRVYSIGLFALNVVPEKLSAPYITVRNFGDLLDALKKYPNIADDHMIVYAESYEVDSALKKYKDIIVDAWKEYTMPRFQLIDGQYVYQDKTDRYVSLINKKDWAYSIYMWFKVLCDGYTEADYRAKQESYGRDVRDRCSFCKTDPPRAPNDYTETQGNCSRCNTFACGNHLYSKSRSYYCPRCY